MVKMKTSILCYYYSGGSGGDDDDDDDDSRYKRKDEANPMLNTKTEHNKEEDHARQRSRVGFVVILAMTAFLIAFTFAKSADLPTQCTGWAQGS
ncbi:hypothetical protein ElyMa_000543900 [Elysia marginata]|uniref:Transmembrane protein n=1 Tax=Elysia marginata TaxID=1093978 RepID=A0AAV4FZU4_9GAST|nr:hypothetical protein ElyMa_000543900 [Elysia marginata]